MLYRAAAYLSGRGLVFAEEQLIPKEALTRDNYAVRVSGCGPTPDGAGDIEIFGQERFDWVFVGREIAGEKSPALTLEGLVKRLKFGGHLIVAVPEENVQPPNLHKALMELGSWKCKDLQDRDGFVFRVMKRMAGPKGITLPPPSSLPRACVVRYGAIGDMIIVTPLLRALKEDGYHVTVNTSPYSAPILDNSPFVDNLILQQRAVIPNGELGQYWEEWAPSYDRYISLSESLEGSLLKVEGRRDFFTHASWRREVCNKNYYTHTVELGGYSLPSPRGEVFLSPLEQKRVEMAKQTRSPRFLLAVALSGSSHHKAYPMLPPVMNDWLDAHPDADVVLLGDAKAQRYAWEHPQVTNLIEKTSIREAICIVLGADGVLGPETFLTNLGGSMGLPTITLLSHSTHENLCKHFPRDFCLSPDPLLAPCYPCHQLHYTLPSCPQGTLYDIQTDEPLASGPLCSMGAIRGEEIQSRLTQIYNLFQEGQNAIMGDSNGPLRSMDTRAA